MWNSMNYSLGRESKPEFSSMCGHDDGTHSISLYLSEDCSVTINGTVAQLEKLRDEIGFALKKIAESAELVASNT